MIWAMLVIGTVFTVCGYFGPEDGGLLELIGLGLVGASFYYGGVFS